MSCIQVTTLELANIRIRELIQIIIGKEREIEELETFIESQMKQGGRRQ
jgi:hypothetical protein